MVEAFRSCWECQESFNSKPPQSLVPFKCSICSRAWEIRLFDHRQLKAYLQSGPLQYSPEQLTCRWCNSFFIHMAWKTMTSLAVIFAFDRVWDGISPLLLVVAGASLTELRRTCQKFSIQNLPKGLFLSSAPFARELRDQALWPPSTEYIFAVRTFALPRGAANLNIVKTFCIQMAWKTMPLLAVVCTSQLVWDGIPCPLREVAGASLTELRQTYQKFAIQSLPKVLFLSSAPFARELRDQALWPPSTEYIFAVRTFGVPRPAANLQIVQCFLHPYGLEDYAVACSCLCIPACMRWNSFFTDGSSRSIIDRVASNLSEIFDPKPPQRLVPFKCSICSRAWEVMLWSFAQHRPVCSCTIPATTKGL